MRVYQNSLRVSLLTTSGGLQMDTVQFLFILSSTEIVTPSTWKQRDKQECQRNFKLRCLNMRAAERRKKTNSICSCVCGEHDFYFFLPFQVFIKTGYNRKQRPSLFLWLHAWETESFAWICTAETGRSWEQTNKTHCKLTRILPSSVNRLMNEEEEEGGGDQQYLKCTNCSRSVCTTCTVSTLELQCRHVQPESHKVMSH